ncbi:uncharacterized protein EV422DRAFT_221366 [Fimicolochytrium jonesii]|uniref:uncharacterized protein n=1 Tax=Fimicolochytrium jonesii TaxID=1396493 RepID=UPI0022FEEC31|nr:uncharacterized protein EV422DRAFT_221366 [Fimicolochytrium jonesii]KAI8817345.1 hypothetical protein EV422DRAFT_221366 [Fimicolochytrium jonesii]
MSESQQQPGQPPTHQHPQHLQAHPQLQQFPQQHLQQLPQHLQQNLQQRQQQQQQQHVQQPLTSLPPQQHPGAQFLTNNPLVQTRYQYAVPGSVPGSMAGGPFPGPGMQYLQQGQQIQQQQRFQPQQVLMQPVAGLMPMGMQQGPMYFQYPQAQQQLQQMQPSIQQHPQYVMQQQGGRPMLAGPPMQQQQPQQQIRQDGGMSQQQYAPPNAYSAPQQQQQQPPPQQLQQQGMVSQPMSFPQQQRPPMASNSFQNGSTGQIRAQPGTVQSSPRPTPPAGPPVSQATINQVLEINQHLIHVLLRLQGHPGADPQEYRRYQERLQTNLTFLATTADHSLKPDKARLIAPAPIPDLTAVLYPKFMSHIPLPRPDASPSSQDPAFKPESGGSPHNNPSPRAGSPHAPHNNGERHSNSPLLRSDQPVTSASGTPSVPHGKAPVGVSGNVEYQRMSPYGPPAGSPSVQHQMPGQGQGQSQGQVPNPYTGQGQNQGQGPNPYAGQGQNQ